MKIVKMPSKHIFRTAEDMVYIISGIFHNFNGEMSFETDNVIIDKHIMIVKKGTTFDGMSSKILKCVFDNKHTYRASLLHDMLYILMRDRVIDIGYKHFADLLFYKILIEDGFNEYLAKLAYFAVDKFGTPAILKREETIDFTSDNETNTYRKIRLIDGLKQNTNEVIADKMIKNTQEDIVWL